MKSGKETGKKSNSNFVKKNIKLVIGIIIGAIISGEIVYAVVSASEVSYTNDKNVKQALDDLYDKVPSGTIEINQKSNQIDVSKYQYADTTALYEKNEIYSSGTLENTTIGNTYQVNIGFVPSKIVFTKVDSGATVLYNSQVNSSSSYFFGTSGIFTESITSQSHTKCCVYNLGTTVTFYTHLDATWNWFAVK